MNTVNFRMTLGMALLVIGLLMPDAASHRLWLNLLGDAVFLASLVLLGGRFLVQATRDFQAASPSARRSQPAAQEPINPASSPPWTRRNTKEHRLVTRPHLARSNT